ncbi:hypothetical protein ABW20_dc0101181 [Dactylellina cionopaga]|nr:hypothetical protein ABW20_dc0101181 [Dactylellina cionopaga]
MSSSYDSLFQAAERLCNDFASKADLQSLLSHFSSSPDITAFEHGAPILAPFLGREFKGVEGITEYFGYLQKYLSYSDMSFSEYFVDEKQYKVSAKGHASFTWLSTGMDWDEVFTYVLDFVEEGDNLKVLRYQVWADTGAL